MKRNRRKICLLTVLVLCIWGVIVLVAVLGGGKQGASPSEAGDVLAETDLAEKPDPVGQTEEPQAEQEIIQPSGKTLESRVAVPEGYTRVECQEGSLGAFLRAYPMKKDGSPVRLYNGKKKGNQSAHAAVFRLPIEEEDLQQCADSVMRVYAEYFWESGQKDRIRFHFVDGFLADYPTWRDGGRISVGTSSSWSYSEGYDDSYGNLKKYLRMVFAYAGTLSMEAESKKIPLKKLRIGDVFLKGASPGHVVMVVDICRNEEGKKAFLLAQGYMPAQEFHLLKNPEHEENPWYYEEEVAYPFQTPEYAFEKGSLRRLSY